MFVEEIRRKICFIHEYNCQVAKVNLSGKYPKTESFTELLVRYVELEQELVAREPAYEKKRQFLLERLLRSIFCDVINFNVPSLSTQQTSLLAVKQCLEVLIMVRPEYKKEDTMLDKLATYLLVPLGCAASFDEHIRGKQLDSQREAFVQENGHNPLAVLASLTTSDYESDSDQELSYSEPDYGSCSSGISSHLLPDVKTEFGTLEIKQEELEVPPVTDRTAPIKDEFPCSNEAEPDLNVISVPNTCSQSALTELPIKQETGLHKVKRAPDIQHEFIVHKQEDGDDSDSDVELVSIQVSDKLLEALKKETLSVGDSTVKNEKIATQHTVIWDLTGSDDEDEVEVKCENKANVVVPLTQSSVNSDKQGQPSVLVPYVQEKNQTQSSVHANGLTRDLCKTAQNLTEKCDKPQSADLKTSNSPQNLANLQSQQLDKRNHITAAPKFGYINVNQKITEDYAREQKSKDKEKCLQNSTNLKTTKTDTCTENNKILKVQPINEQQGKTAKLSQNLGFFLADKCFGKSEVLNNVSGKQNSLTFQATESTRPETSTKILKSSGDNQKTANANFKPVFPVLPNFLETGTYPESNKTVAITDKPKHREAKNQDHPAKSIVGNLEIAKFGLLSVKQDVANSKTVTAVSCVLPKSLETENCPESNKNLPKPKHTEAKNQDHPSESIVENQQNAKFGQVNIVQDVVNSETVTAASLETENCLKISKNLAKSDKPKHREAKNQDHPAKSIVGNLEIAKFGLLNVKQDVANSKTVTAVSCVLPKSLETENCPESNKNLAKSYKPKHTEAINQDHPSKSIVENQQNAKFGQRDIVQDVVNSETVTAASLETENCLKISKCLEKLDQPKHRESKNQDHPAKSIVENLQIAKFGQLNIVQDVANSEAATAASCVSPKSLKTKNCLESSKTVAKSDKPKHMEPKNQDHPAKSIGNNQQIAIYEQLNIVQDVANSEATTAAPCIPPKSLDSENCPESSRNLAKSDKPKHKESKNQDHRPKSIVNNLQIAKFGQLNFVQDVVNCESIAAASCVSPKSLETEKCPEKNLAKSDKPKQREAKNQDDPEKFEQINILQDVVNSETAIAASCVSPKLLETENCLENSKNPAKSETPKQREAKNQVLPLKFGQFDIVQGVANYETVITASCVFPKPLETENCPENSKTVAKSDKLKQREAHHRAKSIVENLQNDGAKFGQLNNVQHISNSKVSALNCKLLENDKSEKFLLTPVQNCTAKNLTKRRKILENLTQDCATNSLKQQEINNEEFFPKQQEPSPEIIPAEKLGIDQNVLQNFENTETLESLNCASDVFTESSMFLERSAEDNRSSPILQKTEESPSNRLQNSEILLDTVEEENLSENFLNHEQDTKMEEDNSADVSIGSCENSQVQEEQNLIENLPILENCRENQKHNLIETCILKEENSEENERLESQSLLENSKIVENLAAEVSCVEFQDEEEMVQDQEDKIVQNPDDLENEETQNVTIDYESKQEEDHNITAQLSEIPDPEIQEKLHNFSAESCDLENIESVSNKVTETLIVADEKLQDKENLSEKIVQNSKVDTLKNLSKEVLKIAAEEQKNENANEQQQEEKPVQFGNQENLTEALFVVETCFKVTNLVKEKATEKFQEADNFQSQENIVVTTTEALNGESFANFKDEKLHNLVEENLTEKCQVLGNSEIVEEIIESCPLENAEETEEIQEENFTEILPSSGTDDARNLTGNLQNEEYKTIDENEHFETTYAVNEEIPPTEDFQNSSLDFHHQEIVENENCTQKFAEETANQHENKEIPTTEGFQDSSVDLQQQEIVENEDHIQNFSEETVTEHEDEAQNLTEETPKKVKIIEDVENCTKDINNQKMLIPETEIAENLSDNQNVFVDSANEEILSSPIIEETPTMDNLDCQINEETNKLDNFTDCTNNVDLDLVEETNTKLDKFQNLSKYEENTEILDNTEHFIDASYCEESQEIIEDSLIVQNNEEIVYLDANCEANEIVHELSSEECENQQYPEIENCENEEICESVQLDFDVKNSADTVEEHSEDKTGENEDCEDGSELKNCVNYEECSSQDFEAISDCENEENLSAESQSPSSQSEDVTPDPVDCAEEEEVSQPEQELLEILEETQHQLVSEDLQPQEALIGDVFVDEESVEEFADFVVPRKKNAKKSTEKNRMGLVKVSSKPILEKIPLTVCQKIEKRKRRSSDSLDDENQYKNKRKYGIRVVKNSGETVLDDEQDRNKHRKSDENKKKLKIRIKYSPEDGTSKILQSPPVEKSQARMKLVEPKTKRKVMFLEEETKNDEVVVSKVGKSKEKEVRRSDDKGKRRLSESDWDKRDEKKKLDVDGNARILSVDTLKQKIKDKIASNPLKEETEKSSRRKSRHKHKKSSRERSRKSRVVEEVQSDVISSTGESSVVVEEDLLDSTVESPKCDNIQEEPVHLNREILLSPVNQQVQEEPGTPLRDEYPYQQFQFTSTPLAPSSTINFRDLWPSAQLNSNLSCFTAEETIKVWNTLMTSQADLKQCVSPRDMQVKNIEEVQGNVYEPPAGLSMFLQDISPNKLCIQSVNSSSEMMQSQQQQEYQDVQPINNYTNTGDPLLTSGLDDCPDEFRDCGTSYAVNNILQLTQVEAQPPNADINYFDDLLESLSNEANPKPSDLKIENVFPNDSAAKVTHSKDVTTSSANTGSDFSNVNLESELKSLLLNPWSTESIYPSGGGGHQEDNKKVSPVVDPIMPPTNHLNHSDLINEIKTQKRPSMSSPDEKSAKRKPPTSSPLDDVFPCRTKRWTKPKAPPKKAQQATPCMYSAVKLRKRKENYSVNDDLLIQNLLKENERSQKQRAKTDKRHAVKEDYDALFDRLKRSTSNFNGESSAS